MLKKATKIVENLNNYQQIVSRETLMIILGSLFIFTLFFPIRYVYFSESAFFTGAYSDFTSFSLYLSDVLITIFFVFNFKRFWDSQIIYFLAILGSWVVVTILSSAGYFPLELYFLVKLFGAWVVFLFFSDIKRLRHAGNIMLGTFLGITFVQCLLGFYQFFAQKSLGLGWFGESPLGLDLPGVAKIVSHGTSYLRIYGTLPHPNLFSAFLMVAIVMVCWQILEAKSKKWLICAYILLYASITGLILTFSRAGYLATAVSLLALGVFYFVKYGLPRRAVVLGLVIVLFASMNVLIFKDFVSTRATISDDAVTQRWFYNKLGLEMIKDHPLTGVGYGSSVLHMKQYSPVPLRFWEIQPIHNYYILTAAEIGLVGFIFLIGFFIYLAVKLAKKTMQTREDRIYLRRIFLGSVLLGVFTLMLFDHYFYTIQSAQMLFWAILGLIWAEVKRDDAAYL